MIKLVIMTCDQNGPQCQMMKMVIMITSGDENGQLQQVMRMTPSDEVGDTDIFDQAQGGTGLHCKGRKQF